MIAAIVLAAGKSERMGSPKALLRFHGRTFVESILAAIRGAGIDRAAVVAGRHYEEIRRALPSLSLVLNPNYEQGMCTSVQAGIRALPAAVQSVGIFLVDHPLVNASTIASLLPHAAPDRIALPVCDGRRGHPVFIGSDFFGEILALGPDQGLNTVVRRDAGRVIEVATADPGVLMDIDTPEQFQNLLRNDA